jgi:hypothetical protein
MRTNAKARIRDASIDSRFELKLEMPAPSIHKQDRQEDGGQHQRREQQGCVRRAGELGKDIGVQEHA